MKKILIIATALVATLNTPTVFAQVNPFAVKPAVEDVARNGVFTHTVTKMKQQLEGDKPLKASLAADIELAVNLSEHIYELSEQESDKDVYDQIIVIKNAYDEYVENKNTLNLRVLEIASRNLTL